MKIDIFLRMVWVLHCTALHIYFQKQKAFDFMNATTFTYVEKQKYVNGIGTYIFLCRLVKKDQKLSLSFSSFL